MDLKNKDGSYRIRVRVEPQRDESPKNWSWTYFIQIQVIKEFPKAVAEFQKVPVNRILQLQRESDFSCCHVIWCITATLDILLNVTTVFNSGSTGLCVVSPSSWAWWKTNGIQHPTRCLKFFLVLSVICVCLRSVGNSPRWLCSPNLSGPTPAGKTRQLFHWREGGRWWDTWCSLALRRKVTTPYCRHRRRWSGGEKEALKAST